MDGKTAKLIELALVFGGVLGLAIWQWLSVRRELRRDERRARTAGDESRLPPDG